MSQTIKTFLTLFALVGILSACSSNSSKTGEVEATPTPEATPDVSTMTEEDPMEMIKGVATTFYFEFDQSILSSEARAALAIHAEYLSSNPSSIRLEGHADERGSREYNMALGERRANAVRDFLVLQGADSSMIETVSYGEERPAEIGSYESAWSANRRVVLQY